MTDTTAIQERGKQIASLSGLRNRLTFQQRELMIEGQWKIYITRSDINGGGNHEWNRIRDACVEAIQREIETVDERISEIWDTRNGGS